LINDRVILFCVTGDPDGAKGRFNFSHIKTRNLVERSFGVLKNRFFALKTGNRLKDPQEASKLILSACILHNLAIKFGDHGEEWSSDEDDDEDDNEDDEETNLALPDVEEGGTAAENRERRRNQLLQFFQRN
jgi:hypothetical protein